MGAKAFKSAVQPKAGDVSPILADQLSVSRANFRFVTALSSTGESVVWLAHNIENPREKFFIKQTSKYAVYNHKRIPPVLKELQILTQISPNCAVDLLFAFQDFDSLYLVSPGFDSFTLEEVLANHTFTEDETKRVVMALMSIIEEVHRNNYALVELSPRNILVDKITGQLKLFEVINAAELYSNYASNMVAEVSPYSAPQILLKDRVLGESDYYSLGLIMYEMMTQRRAIPAEQGGYSRMGILRRSIEVVKSDLPEGWKPEATDFLIKLIIKNPLLRLGRYGSSELKNHVWLKNCNWSSHFSELRLTQSYFHSKRTANKALSFPIKPERSHVGELRSNYLFQELFQKYHYVRKQRPQRSESEDDMNEDELEINERSSLNTTVRRISRLGS